MEPQSTYGCEWCVDGLQADGETPCPCQEADLPRQVRDFKRVLAEANEKIDRLQQELDEVRRMLFPYADAKEISGYSCDGIYLIGNRKSIKAAKTALHYAGQLEEYRSAFRERSELLERDLRISRNEAECMREQSIQNSRERNAFEARAERLEKALRFYASERRYNGVNQRNDGTDEYTSPNAAYIQDAMRDGGTIARAALQREGE